MSKAEYRNPTPTVDIIIEVGDQIVLIKRKNPPVGYAIPGGFVDEGETVEQAAIREAKEETNLDVTLTDLLYVYSDPKRDPRLHTISVVFVATSSGEPVASDDAAEVVCIALSDLPSNIVFDHPQILKDYAEFKATGKRPRPNPQVS